MEFQESVLAEMADCTTRSYAEGHAVYCFVREFAGVMSQLDVIFNGGVRAELYDIAFTFITFVTDMACEGEFGDEVRVEVTINGLESYFSAKNWVHIEELIEHYAHVGRGVELDTLGHVWKVSWGVASNGHELAKLAEKYRKKSN